MEIIDITKGIFSSEVYPGDPEPEKQNFQSIENGDGCNLNGYFACCHAGTHADAPLHFVEDGKAIDEMSMIPFIGPCRVLDVPPGPITGEYVENASSCAMCKRLIINAGIEWVVIRNNKDEYTSVNVRDWIYNDDTLGSGSY